MVSTYTYHIQRTPPEKSTTEQGQSRMSGYKMNPRFLTQYTVSLSTLSVQGLSTNRIIYLEKSGREKVWTGGTGLHPCTIFLCPTKNLSDKNILYKHVLQYHLTRLFSLTDFFLFQLGTLRPLSCDHKTQYKVNLVFKMYY